MSAAVSFACPTGPFVRSEIESRTEALPGAAATIVCSNGSSWTGVYGEAALGSGRPIAADSVFQIASISKTFAGVALALAQSEGLLQLDEPLYQTLPTARIGQGGAGKAINLIHLASQSSGLLPHSYTNFIEERSDYDSMIKKLRHAPFICRPGACYSYQNVAFSLIGDAIERRSEITYQAFVEKKIFSPLGMQDAWLGKKAPPGRELVSPHVRTKAGWRAARPNNQYYKVLPAAGVNASIADMKRWLEALLGLTPLLAPELLEQIGRKRVDYKAHQGHYPRSAPLSETGYAMGFRTFAYRQVPGFLHHGGYIRGMRSEMILHPPTGMGLAFLTNSEPDRLNRLSLAFADWVVDQALIRAD